MSETWQVCIYSVPDSVEATLTSHPPPPPSPSDTYFLFDGELSEDVSLE